MSRTTQIYILTIALSAALFWGLLKIGSHLTAPPSLAGQWDITAGTAAFPIEEDFGSTLAVEQSGRYFSFKFDGDRTTLGLKLVESKAAAGGITEMTLAGDRAVTARLSPDRKEMAVQITTPRRTAFVARLKEAGR